jgi:hypothetical protein
LLVKPGKSVTNASLGIKIQAKVLVLCNLLERDTINRPKVGALYRR